jgi:DnaJ-class molecular chaperone
MRTLRQSLGQALSEHEIAPQPPANDARFSCPRCNGRGFVFVHALYSSTRVGCPECKGAGKISRASAEEKR